MILSIGKYIYPALSAIQGLTVYPVVADFNTSTPSTPFAVYQRTGAEPVYTKSLFTGEIRHYYSVTVVDNDYTDTVLLAQSVADAMLALSHKVKEDVRFGQVMVTDISEDFIDGLFTQSINFEINTTEL